MQYKVKINRNSTLQPKVLSQLILAKTTAS